jgi:hypothetical protein
VTPPFDPAQKSDDGALADAVTGQLFLETQRRAKDPEAFVDWLRKPFDSRKLVFGSFLGCSVAVWCSSSSYMRLWQHTVEHGGLAYNCEAGHPHRLVSSAGLGPLYTFGGYPHPRFPISSDAAF